ncbi:MAG: transcription termination factor Rho [Thermoguttaceae bacterium]|jgi:transcription termination factor Rho
MADKYTRQNSRPKQYNRFRQNAPYPDRKDRRYPPKGDSNHPNDFRNVNNPRYNREGLGRGNRNYRDGGYRDSVYRDNTYRDGGYRSGVYRDNAYRHGGYRSGPDRNSEDNWSGRPQNNRTRQHRNGTGQNRSQQPFEPADPSTYVEVSGVLETHPNGFGFLRNPEENYSRLPADPFVPAALINKLNLRQGVLIKGMAQPSQQELGSRLMEVQEIDGLTPAQYAEVKPFDEMTPINPEFWIRLSTGPEPISTRVMDLLTPLGKGQRALIVAPPRSGKTVLLQQISQAVTTNYPDIHVFVLLIDERPEEVTDFRRAVTGAEVVSSSLDCNLESHVRIAQFIIERCKRLAEEGKDVFLLLDSITRLARAFNKWVGNTGRTMSGGIDIKAMDIPKKIFSSARLNEGGGSLTIVGTALIDTGSRMDELIFQEFKGTGNMDLVLDRRLADRRVWPAIDISKSGTRREEKLLPPETLHAVNMIRRIMTPMNPVEAMEKLVKELSRYESNEEFFNRFIRHE